MKNIFFNIGSVAVVLLWASSTLLAHHSFAAEFDSEQPVELHGAVIAVDWVNPHAWIHVAVEKEDGTTEAWMVEGGAPNALLRRGFNKNSLPPGIKIFVEGYQAKDGAMRANGRDITFEDGSKLFVGSSGTGAPSDGRDPTER